MMRRKTDRPAAGRTTTAVRDERTLHAVIGRSARRESALALSTLLYAVLLSMSALKLLSISANAAWLSLLGALVPAFAVYALSARCAAKRQGSLPRAAAGIFALLFFSDMALCLLSLSEMVCAYMLPRASRVTVGVIAAGSIALALRKRERCSGRIAAFLCVFFLSALFCCLLIALPLTDTGYLFPLMGYGAGQTLRGGAYIAGGLWSAAAIPFFTCGGQTDKVKKSRVFLFPLLASGLMTLLLFFYALLLPAPLLPGDWGFVLQLQLIMEMSPNTLSFSLMLISRLLLFLTAFTVAGEHAALCAQRALRRPARAFLLLAAAPLLVPLHLIKEPLAVLLPLRFPLAALTAAALAVSTHRKERRHG